MYRKLRHQWVLMPILIMLTFSGSFLVLKSSHKVNVYYVRTTVRTTENSVSVTPVKHVTKSMAELGKMDEINKFVLFLNQIPNCGAEVLIFLLQKMQGPNNYRHVRLKSANNKNLNEIQQEEFVDEVYKIIRDEAVPLSFDQQIYFVNFTKHDKQSPTYINLIREPADKAISRSFYLRKSQNKTDFVQCLSKGKINCSEEINPQEMTIPYFCGQNPKCLLNDQWALRTAKNNVERYFPVVGVLEEMKATLGVFEREIPYFFKGVQSIYKSKMSERFNNKKKLQRLPKVRKQLRRILANEYEFYNWIKQRLFQQLEVIVGNH